MEKEYPRLDSTNGVMTEEIEVDDVKITPLFSEETPKGNNVEAPKKEVSIQEYIDIQCNKVVAFMINWIKTAYTNDLMTWLNGEFKNELIKELKK